MRRKAAEAGGRLLNAAEGGGRRRKAAERGDSGREVAEGRGRRVRRCMSGEGVGRVEKAWEGVRRRGNA